MFFSASFPCRGFSLHHLPVAEIMLLLQNIFLRIFRDFFFIILLKLHSEYLLYARINWKISMANKLNMWLKSIYKSPPRFDYRQECDDGVSKIWIDETCWKPNLLLSFFPPPYRYGRKKELWSFWKVLVFLWRSWQSYFEY